MSKRPLIVLGILLLLLLSMASGQKLGSGTKVGSGTRIATASPSAATPTPTPDFLTDTFTAATDEDLTAHTPEVGSTWIDHTDGAYSDPIGILASEDQIYKTSGSGAGMYYNDAAPPSANYCCECVMRKLTTISANASIAWRVDTASNTMMIFQINNGTGWRMRKIVAGTQTTIGVEDTTTNIPADGESRTMTACSNGNTHTAFINGVLLGTVGGTDSSVTAAGKAGVRFNGTFTSTTGYHLSSLRCYPL